MVCIQYSHFRVLPSSPRKMDPSTTNFCSSCRNLRPFCGCEFREGSFDNLEPISNPQPPQGPPHQHHSSTSAFAGLPSTSSSTPPNPPTPTPPQHFYAYSHGAPPVPYPSYGIPPPVPPQIHFAMPFPPSTGQAPPPSLPVQIPFEDSTSATNNHAGQKRKSKGTECCGYDQRE